jgi:WD40 repeat protein
VWDIGAASYRSVNVGGVPGAWGLAIDPTGSTIAIGLASGRIRLYDARTLALKPEFAAAHDGAISRLAFSHDGRWLASGSSDRTARVWDAASGRQVALINSRNGTTRSVRFTPDDRSLVVTGWWRLERWSTDDWRQQTPDLGRAEAWFDTDFSADGRLMIAAGEYGSVRMWDLAGSAVASRIAHAGPVTGLTWDGWAGLLVSTGADGQVVTLDSLSGARVVATGIAARQVAVSPGGGVLTAGVAPAIAVTTRGVRMVIESAGQANAALRSGAGIVAVFADGTVRRYDQDGVLAVKASTGRGEPIALAVSPVGDSTFVACRDQSIARRSAEISRKSGPFSQRCKPSSWRYRPTGGHSPRARGSDSSNCATPPPARFARRCPATCAWLPASRSVPTVTASRPPETTAAVQLWDVADASCWRRSHGGRSAPRA